MTYLVSLLTFPPSRWLIV
uniref:Uncharacterized protein n=1 Tax=Rhizophora mucronata TaxID=61149 RepID=A0A2P2PGN8_RHIMU